MKTWRVLDTYCGDGGASRGYQLAGAYVVGVDIKPHPNHCGDDFYQGDAVSFIRKHGHKFDFVHTSPPCQAYSNLNAYNHKDYPELIVPTREALKSTGVPYVIENVEAAKGELINPVMLCGPMFGLKVYRHRMFETNWALSQPEHPKHVALCARNGYLPTPDRPFMTITGGKHSRAWQRRASEYMGVPWMRDVRAVCEAIPPAYTQYVAEQFLAQAWREAA